MYCPEKKSGERYNVPSGFSVMTEIGEAAAAILDQKVVTLINKYSHLIEYMHFSDQYSGPKQTE